MVVAACTEPHVPLSDFVPDVDPLLSTLVDRCLEKDPSRRPPDAGTLLIDLGRVLGLSSLPPPRRSIPERGTPNTPPTDASVRTSGIRMSFHAGLRRALVGRWLKAAAVLSVSIGAAATAFVPTAWPVLVLGVLVGAGALLAANVSGRRRSRRPAKARSARGQRDSSSQQGGRAQGGGAVEAPTGQGSGRCRGGHGPVR